MAYKIRVQKKKEVAPAQIASRSEEIIGHLLDNPKIIWGGIALAILIAGVVFTKQFSDKSSDEAAWLIESEASKLFHDPPPLPEPVEEGEEEIAEELLEPEGRLKKASELYDEIIEKYPENDVAAIALFESGNVFYKLKDYDKAEERLKSFIEKYPRQEGLVTISHLKLAYLYQVKGNDSAALSHFRTVYEMNDSLSRDQAGFELARALEAGEKTDEANAIYTDISESASESPWGAEAKARLLLLNSSSEATEDGTSAEGAASTEQAQDPVPDEETTVETTE